MPLINTIAGLVASALAAMGVGGGGLLVIYLTEIAKTEQRTAQGINLLFFLCASLSALAIHSKTRKLALFHALFFAIGGTVGAVIGCTLSQNASNQLLRRAFGILLLYAGTATLLRNRKQKRY